MQCIYCWIAVVKQAVMKPVLGTVEDNAPKWIHKKLRSEAGNPYCGRQFLEDDEVEPADPTDAET